MLDKKRSVILLIIIYIGFISLGLPDGILGVAWSSIRAELNQPVAYAGILSLILYSCSSVSSFSSASILRKFSTGKLLMICGFMTGFALLGFALSPAFWCMLLLVIPLGLGQGAIDTGMNFYVAKHHTSRDMNWLHCCWGIGACSGPFLVTMILAHGCSWRWGYAVAGCVQFILAALFLSTLSLWRDSAATENSGSVESHPVNAKPEKNGRFWCCTLTFWLYAGFEVSIGLWVYTFLTTSRGVSNETAGFTATAFFAMLTAGRFLIGFIANQLGNKYQILCGALLAFICGILMAVPGPHVLTLIAVGLLGFASAPLYPAMMHAVPERFDHATAASVIGYQSGAAMVGVMTIPPAFGFIAAHTTFNLLPYLVILLTGLILVVQSKVDGLWIRKYTLHG